MGVRDEEESIWGRFQHLGQGHGGGWTLLETQVIQPPDFWQWLPPGEVRDASIMLCLTQGPQLP